MNQIEIKSTGTLFDEWITAKLKTTHFPEDMEIQDRHHDLGNALAARLLRMRIQKVELDQKLVWAKVKKLQDVLTHCWNAQEIVYKYQGLTELNDADLAQLADAALAAQRTNAERNKYIRDIDYLMGELNTQLIKTYS